MLPNNDLEELKALILENRRLLDENNQILQKMRRMAVWDFAIRSVLMALFLGLPFIAYFYIVEPYYNALQGTLHSIQEMSKIPRLEGMLPLHSEDLGN